MIEASQGSVDFANRCALITGVNGQDGAYLAKLLLDKGYLVYGTSRDARGSSFANLRRLGVADRVKCLSLVPEDFRSVFTALNKSHPSEVYHLAGQSSVGHSFEEPAETIESIAIGTLNILEACRLTDRPVRLYHAGSGDCYGNTPEPADEKTSFRPTSPYAVAKVAAFWLVSNYREAYNSWACTGILFNHESPLRPSRFVTQKIVLGAKRIASGIKEKLVLGRLDISRDWGWAPDYVEAMWRMLQRESPSDYVIATGETNRLEDLVEHAFACQGLNWRDHVEQSDEFFRPTDLLIGRANPEKARQELHWVAGKKMRQVVELMLADAQS